jgi:hypothetical protein
MLRSCERYLSFEFPNLSSESPNQTPVCISLFSLRSACLTRLLLLYLMVRSTHRDVPHCAISLNPPPPTFFPLHPSSLSASIIYSRTPSSCVLSFIHTRNYFNSCTRQQTRFYRVIRNDCRGFNNLSYTRHLR